MVNAYTNYLKRFFANIIPNLKNFGIKLVFLNLIADASTIFKNNPISIFLRKKQHDAIYSFLTTHYSNIIENYESKEIKTEYTNNKVIWCFWWQGVENAPKIVKKCIENIEKYSRDYELTLLDKNNYKDYLDLPAEIIKKLESNTLSMTHFSDILRIKLLSEYGGIWIDSTVFICDDIFKEFDDMIFNTATLPENKTDFFSKGKWCIFLIGGKPNKLFSFVYELMIHYYLEFDSLINYFLLDYIIEIAYNSFEECKEYIDNSNLYNPEVLYYLENPEKTFILKDFEEFNNKYKFFKLTYKINPSQFYDKKGNLTNIGYFTSENM